LGNDSGQPNVAIFPTFAAPAVEVMLEHTNASHKFYKLTNGGQTTTVTKRDLLTPTSKLKMALQDNTDHDNCNAKSHRICSTKRKSCNAGDTTDLNRHAITVVNSSGEPKGTSGGLPTADTRTGPQLECARSRHARHVVSHVIAGSGSLTATSNVDTKAGRGQAEGRTTSSNPVFVGVIPPRDAPTEAEERHVSSMSKNFAHNVGSIMITFRASLPQPNAWQPNTTATQSPILLPKLQRAT
jgi:hypothetical protein